MQRVEQESGRHPCGQATIRDALGDRLAAGERAVDRNGSIGSKEGDRVKGSHAPSNPLVRRDSIWRLDPLCKGPWDSQVKISRVCPPPRQDEPGQRTPTST